MHHHSGGLVDDGQIVVFVEDIEGNLFGDGAQGRPRGRTEYGDALSTTKFQGCLGRHAVQQNFFCTDELLHPRPAHILKLRREELVQALARIFRHNGNKNWKFRHRCEGYYTLPDGTARTEIDLLQMAERVTIPK